MSTYLTTAEAAERLRVAPQTMRVWRSRGDGPRFSKPTVNRVLYNEAEIERFLQERTFSSTTEETVRRESAAAV